MIGNEVGVSKLIANKAHFRELVIRYGYNLPHCQAFCTVEYMHGVVNGDLYCPKFTESRVAPCPVRPKKEVILAEVVRVLGHSQLTLGDTTRALPEVDWLLMVLATIAPDHIFFARAYRPPPRVRKPKKMQQP